MSAQQPSPRVVITALGFAQILAWGTSFYFPAVLAAPIVADTGWSLAWVVGGTSIGLLVAGLISPQVGRLVHDKGGRPVLAASSLLFAAGLAGIGLAPSLPFYLIAWIVLGAGMGFAFNIDLLDPKWKEGKTGCVFAETIEITPDGARRMHTFPTEFQRLPH